MPQPTEFNAVLRGSPPHEDGPADFDTMVRRHLEMRRLQDAQALGERLETTEPGPPHVNAGAGSLQPTAHTPDFDAVVRRAAKYGQ